MVAADLGKIIADLPTSVTIGGNAACNARIGSLRDGDGLEIAGVMEELGISVYVLKSSVSTAVPAPGMRVTIGSKSYRAITVISDPCGAGYELTCEAETR